jgi:O-antigen biosynthesis protein
MDLSVIIVSYNVKYFLEQCIHSVVASAGNISSEIIVTDNNSVDGSCRMVKEKFPAVKLISNDVNRGFAAACNQGIRISSGRYVLLLNPDTVIQEDTLGKCLSFMEEHADAGCMGVKMIDGKGRYLPESKRALPTPSVSFYKIFGMAALFPSSRRFGRYYLGHLDRDQTHEVEVLTGAFMFIRRAALDKCGLTDEDYFMYGEDVDLSYRIIQAGYKNYYYPGTTIIHYKGESTKKASFNYVFLFYNAMRIFARKHFSGRSASYFIFLINIAIYFRAALSVLQRFIRAVINPAADAAVIYIAYLFFLPLWAKIIFGENGSYPPEVMHFVIPSYIAVWLVSLYLNGGYEKSVRLSQIEKGILTGTVFILIIYALLPENLRYSRAMILTGTIWAMIALPLLRLLLSLADPADFRLLLMKGRKRIIIIGRPAECKRAAGILRHSNTGNELCGFVSADAAHASSEGYIGHLGQITDIAKIHLVDEMVFCSKDLPAQEIVKTMLLVSGSNVTFKIAAPGSLSIIGSNSINSAGELYGIYANTLSRPINRTKKRLFDIAASLLFLVISPVALFFVKAAAGYLKNILTTLSGRSTWVGYCAGSPVHPELPALKPGVLTPADASGNDVPSATPESLNLLYAKNYSISRDALIMAKAFSSLGRPPLLLH